MDPLQVAVISGIGTRNYYRKLGYQLHAGDGGFMTKVLPAHRSFVGYLLTNPRRPANLLRATLAALVIALIAVVLRLIHGGMYE